MQSYARIDCVTIQAEELTSHANFVKQSPAMLLSSPFIPKRIVCMVLLLGQL